MFTTRPEIAGTFGVVASTHWIASQSGMAVLERGGNAFDAAAAAGFVLHVAEPHLNGPGGDAPIIVHDDHAGTQHVICGQGVAPAGASIDAFRELGIDFVRLGGRFVEAIELQGYDLCNRDSVWVHWSLVNRTTPGTR